MIADDESLIRQAYTDGFTRAGFDVQTAVDGVEALEKIHSAPPEIILLDIIMPRKTGFDVLKELKSDSKLKSIPVVILSNLSQATDEVEVRRLGASDFFVKSDFSLKELVDRVRDMMGTKPAESTTS